MMFSFIRSVFVRFLFLHSFSLFSACSICFTSFSIWILAYPVWQVALRWIWTLWNPNQRSGSWTWHGWILWRSVNFLNLHSSWDRLSSICCCCRDCGYCGCFRFRRRLLLCYYCHRHSNSVKSMETISKGTKKSKNLENNEGCSVMTYQSHTIFQR